MAETETAKNRRAVRYATGAGLTAFVGMSAAVMGLPYWPVWLVVAMAAYSVLFFLAARSLR